MSGGVLVFVGRHGGLEGFLGDAGGPVHVVAEPGVLRVVGPRLAGLARSGRVVFHRLVMRGDWEARLLGLYVDLWPRVVVFYRVVDERLGGIAFIHERRVGGGVYSYSLGGELVLGARVDGDGLRRVLGGF